MSMVSVMEEMHMGKGHGTSMPSLGAPQNWAEQRRGPGFNPWISQGRSPGERNGYPLQCFYLGNPMDRGAWWATVHGVAKSQTWLSDFTFTFHFHALKKKMATHSSVLSWRIPGTGEPGGLPSMGSHRVGHDWSDSSSSSSRTLQNILRTLKMCIKEH